MLRENEVTVPEISDASANFSLMLVLRLKDADYKVSHEVKINEQAQRSFSLGDCIIHHRPYYRTHCEK